MNMATNAASAISYDTLFSPYLTRGGTDIFVRRASLYVHRLGKGVAHVRSPHKWSKKKFVEFLFCDCSIMSWEWSFHVLPLAKLSSIALYYSLYVYNNTFIYWFFKNTNSSRDFCKHIPAVVDKVRWYLYNYCQTLFADSLQYPLYFMV